MKNALILLFVIYLLPAYGGDPMIKCFKKKIEGIASIEALGPQGDFKEVYDIRLLQPVDHKDPGAGAFEQRIYVYHKSRRKPVVFVTEGYSLRKREYELAQILDANQIQVEYRFYGKSGSDDIKWDYLDNTQAAADLHRIKTMFDDIYKKEWISTGISKGGTTTMIYKALYPDDVDASVNYVGPLPLAQEDTRMDDHIKSIGSDECRKKLFAFQRDALRRTGRILPMVDSLAKADKHSFSIGLGSAYEYAVLEYTFSFWQYAHPCNEVPDSTATDKEVFLHINDIVGYDFYSDATYDAFKNAFYQFMGENGYYGFVHDHLKDLLIYVTRPTNLTFTPRDVRVSYDPTFMNNVEKALDEVGDKIIHIHGEYDPWGAVGYFPDEKQDAVLIIHPKGSHTTRIKNLSEEDQSKVYTALEKWLKAHVEPVEENRS
jgi:hypothetical protein